MTHRPMPPAHALNAGLFSYLKVDPADPLSFQAPDALADPYMGAGCHPDIVTRVWRELGAPLPTDCRFIVGGRPGLVHPHSGVVFALALGTQYCLRLPPAVVPLALAAGAKTTTTWAGGAVLDLPAAFGPGWVFGGWSSKEPAWCAEAFQSFGVG